MSTPEYLVCLECETPCYVFEWQDGKITEILCTVCGAEDPDEFATPDEFDALGGGERPGEARTRT